MPARIVKIDDPDRAGEVRLCEIPDPFGPISNEDFLYGAARAPIPGFLLDALAELFGGLDGTRVGGRVWIPDCVAFLVPPGLSEHASQLDLSRVGWLAVSFTFTAQPRGLEAVTMSCGHREHFLLEGPPPVFPAEQVDIRL